MRRVLDWMLILAVALAVGYLWYTHPSQVRGVISSIEARIHPCASPVTYSIGSIDPRFGISTSTLITDLEEAEAIWEKPSGKNLFQYEKSGGDVSVSLAYDNRQAATDKLKTLGIELDTSKSSFDNLKAQY